MKKIVGYMVRAMVFFFLCISVTGRTVCAEEQIFIIQAELFSSGNVTYDVSISVENTGENWEGIVRMQIGNSYGVYDVAYDTVLSLPQGSKKQFIVRIPKRTIEGLNSDGTVVVSLRDRNLKEIAAKAFKKLIRDDADVLAMGILSDTYGLLTYLDMGGAEIYFAGDKYPIRLIELNQDNLLHSLDTLKYLVIDNYNTSVLSEDTLNAIESWMDKGGELIVGTGKYAENTLSGLDYLEVTCKEVHNPEENVLHEDVYLDESQLMLAELDYNGGKSYYREPHDLALVCSWGDGAYAVLPYSFAELGKLDSTVYQGLDQSTYVMSLLEDVGNMTKVRYSSNQSDNKYAFNRLFRYLGNGDSRLNFSVLRWIVIVYVVFAGPVLYLILRFMKKRDFYWIAVPAAALMGIFLVYWAGRGFEIVGATVYSVTIRDLSGNENTETSYLRCFNAGHQEWDLCLAEHCEYAGPYLQTNYNYSINAAGTCYYHVKKEGDKLFFGINPESVFEDGYFMAGSKKEPTNDSIVMQGINSVMGKAGLQGTVTNQTDWDFAYFAVIADNNLYIYQNLPSGETFDLSSVKSVYYCGGDIVNAYLYNCMNDIAFQKDTSDADILAALGMGVCQAYSEDNPYAVIVIGVTKGWDGIVNDDCKETSYGCLYAIQ